MARVHLFEFEDFQWFPSNIRNYMTDFLQFAANKFDFYAAIVPVLRRGVESAETNEIIDLASGGGGGWQRLSEHVKEELPGVKVRLTDFYPNLDAFKRTKALDPDFFEYSESSVNALDVPKEFKGLRTQFLSLHHFKPEDAQRILQNAVDSNSPIALFEAQKRSVGDFIKFMFSPLNVLFSTPFIKPFKVGRIVFTYLIPLVPIFTWWDGLVSVLRTYSKKELEQIIGKLDNGDKFDWEIDFVKKGPVKIYYLLGTPSK